MALVLDLKKSLELNLEKAGIEVPIMECRLAIDRSGSMGENFANGFVSNTVDLFIAAALKFDDNGILDMGFFNTDFEEAPEATLEDAGQYMKGKGRQFYACGGTHFAPIIEAFETHWDTRQIARADRAPAKKGFLAKLSGMFNTAVEAVTETDDKACDYRAYVGIITDGDNGDHSAFARALKQTSGDTFFQFIGIGNDVNVSYLDSIAQSFPHVGFFHLQNPKHVQPDAFYEQMCNQKFANWIEAGK